MASLGLALIAGILTTLSPCVLPLLPAVLGAAATEHRLAPMALAAGLSLSFTAIGLFVAIFGFSIGLDTDVFRAAAAVGLMLVGAVLAVPALRTRFAILAAPLGNWLQARFGGGPAQGASGQFALGLLLGAVWTPCAGPTLGAASLLASQGKQLGEVALVMVVFGVGAALPPLALGLLSREAMTRWRSHALGQGHRLRTVLGAILIIVGIGVLTGADKVIEAALIAVSPQWLTQLTTRF